MASKQITCSQCGIVKWVQWTKIQKQFKIFDCDTIDELQKHWLCIPCKKTHKPSNLRDLPEYTYLATLLQIEYNTLIKRGTNDSIARQNFLDNVKHILDKRNIKQYTLHIVNNVLMGIILENLPLFGSVLVPLKNQRS